MSGFFSWFTGAEAKQHFIALCILIFLLGFIIFGGFRDDVIIMFKAHPDWLAIIAGSLGIGASYVGPKKPS